MAKFMVDYRFNGRGGETIEADTLEDAKAIVDAKIDNDYFDPPVDDFDDIDAAVKELHPVTRSEREIWTTYVLPTDTRGHASALSATPLFGAAA